MWPGRDVLVAATYWREPNKSKGYREGGDYAECLYFSKIESVFATLGLALIRFWSFMMMLMIFFEN